MTQKDAPHVWSKGYDEAFKRLRSLLTSAPVFGYPMPEARFILDTDASEIGLGAVLSQEQNGQERVIAYFSRTTDHACLQWLLTFRCPEGQIARWLQKLQEYNFEVQHRAGKSHGNADALSRRPCAEFNCA